MIMFQITCIRRTFWSKNKISGLAGNNAGILNVANTKYPTHTHYTHKWPTEKGVWGGSRG